MYSLLHQLAAPTPDAIYSSSGKYPAVEQGVALASEIHRIGAIETEEIGSGHLAKACTGLPQRLRSTRQCRLVHIASRRAAGAFRQHVARPHGESQRILERPRFACRTDLHIRIRADAKPAASVHVL